MNKILRLVTTIFAIGGITIGAGAILTTPTSAATPGAAEGDAYPVYGQIFLLGQPPIRVPSDPLNLTAPLDAASVRTTAPPGVTNFVQGQVYTFQSCDDPLNCTQFSQPLVDFVNVLPSTAKATITPVATTNCFVPGAAIPPDFYTGPLTGGNACAGVSSAGLINQSTTPPTSNDLVVTGEVEAQSTTQSCTATPTGTAHIAHLELNGQTIIGPGSSISQDPAPNTVVEIPNVVKLILNEQVYDGQGHGLTVNAIHVFTASGLGTLANADVILVHAHSEAFCSDNSTTDTGGGNNTPQTLRPTVTKTDSTKHANPGEQVTYTVTIDNQSASAAGCPVTSVTDVLPANWTLVSASGDLGDSPTETVTNDGVHVLEFFASGGQAFSTNPLVETLVVKVADDTPPGQYINNVFGTSDCGSFNGSDMVPVTSGPPSNQGPNPGIIVPRAGGNPTPTARPSASPSPNTRPPAPSPSPKLPNTAAGPGLFGTHFGLFGGPGGTIPVQMLLGLALTATGLIALATRIYLDARGTRRA